ncbi:MAG: hypothetical protein H7835_11705 [Magnetococcus sp. XQGC-1]
MPTIRQYRKNTLNPQSRWLLESTKNITSQYGEDGIIETIFSKIVPLPNGPWCVEFGARGGVRVNNTFNLIFQEKWQGVLIEGNPKHFPGLQKVCQGHDNAYPVNRLIGLEGEDSLDNILKQTPCPTQFDLVSMDVDGRGWHIWKSLVAFRPRVVLVAFNPNIPNDVVFIQDPDPTVNQASSLLAFVELGKEKGYELICATCCNAFFIVAEEFRKLGIKDNSIDAMYMPSIDEKVFDLFDGKRSAAQASQP